MVCIQCYLPPILFMVYMKLIHPYLAPYLEPAIDKVIAWIYGPQAVTQGCPIRPKGKKTEESQAGDASSSNQQQPNSTATAGKDEKTKAD